MKLDWLYVFGLLRLQSWNQADVTAGCLPSWIHIRSCASGGRFSGARDLAPNVVLEYQRLGIGLVVYYNALWVGEVKEWGIEEC